MANILEALNDYTKARVFSSAPVKVCSRGLRPCLHVLEEVSCTKVNAYCHVIAWTKVLHDNGYRNLDQSNINC